MQTLTEKVFELAPPWGLFDETVLENLFGEKSAGARKAMVHRAVVREEVVRLRPGLFCLASRYRSAHPHPFVVASMLFSPSHISMETALWHHGLIPEAVLEVASVTTKRSRRFRNPLGNFSYTRVPSDSPRAGVRATEVDTDGWAFIATPLRAIADIVYTRRQVRWELDGLRFLTESLRIDLDDLASLPLGDAREVLVGIRNQRTLAFIEGLAGELSGGALP